MNELQKKQLRLLQIFIEVCKRLGLEYYLVCGSALGAVKYKGFIPWDDDVDVGMPREDYQIFQKEAQALLPKGIFLQNYKTDPKYPNIFSKLRDSETTYIEKSVAELDINHGIYIDIFPLDGYPSDEKEKRKLEKKKARCKKKLSCVYTIKRGLKAKLGCFIRRRLGYHKKTQVILAEYESVISAYETKGSRIWCNHGNWQGSLEYAMAEQYGSGTKMSFEGLQVIVPQRYEQYLRQKYGDYEADPPKEKQVGHHYYTVCDTQKAFTEYKKQKY